MNKPIRTMAVFCLLLFLALMINATMLQYVRAGALDKDPRNRRVIDAAFSRDRGAIMVGRDAIAESVKSDDRYQYQRRYTQPLLYAPVTGFFSYYSQTGIEQTQNEVLSGDDPRLFVTRLVDLVSNTSPKGGRVQLTIDPAAQKAAYDGLKAIPGVQGAVVAIEPSSGKILAMVSLPSYDPNLMATHDFQASGDNYDKLLHDPGQPLLNRAIQTRLPPGSTFKLVTASAALEDGLYDNVDALVPGGPVYQLPQSTKKIDNGGRNCGTDEITMTQAIANSCNTSFLAIANELGHDKLEAQAEAYGFNSDYFTDLRPQAQSVYPKEADPPQTAMTGIGQFNVAATPLQMAMVAAGIANSGVVMKPYLVDRVLSPDLDVLDQTRATEYSRAISPTTASELTKAMVATVSVGTASPAAIPGVEVAGKTGTAENCSACKNYAWFVSFAPANDPQVAVAVMIQGTNVPNEDIAGGLLGGPVARAVMEAVMGS
ncbi:MAG: penicillin-binding protein 2 [Nocardioidaceae bacterium]|nr:penicillin-binding protein 2 [Nocardioidaceae bacterium]